MKKKELKDKITVILMGKYSHERNCVDRTSGIKGDCDCGRNNCIRTTTEALLKFLDSQENTYTLENRPNIPKEKWTKSYVLIGDDRIFLDTIEQEKEKIYIFKIRRNGKEETLNIGEPLDNLNFKDGIEILSIAQQQQPTWTTNDTGIKVKVKSTENTVWVGMDLEDRACKCSADCECNCCEMRACLCSPVKEKVVVNKCSPINSDDINWKPGKYPPGTREYKIQKDSPLPEELNITYVGGDSSLVNKINEIIRFLREQERK